MKKFLKYFLLASCLCLMVFSLTSCFEAEYEYTEWEIGQNTITNGEVVYNSVNLPGWRLSENYFFRYGETVSVGKNENGVLYRPKDSDKLIAMVIYNEYSRDYLDLKFYIADGGEHFLSGLGKDNLYLHDSENSMSAPISSVLREYLPQLDRTDLKKEEISSEILNKAEKVELVSYGADGFLAYARGVFYYYNDTVYFLNADEHESYVAGGYTNVGTDTDVIVYEITDGMRSALKENRKSMQKYTLQAEYEQPYIDMDAVSINQRAAKAMLLILVSFVGIAIPGVPLVFMTKKGFRKKWNLPTVDYILFGSLALWLVSGIVCFILFSI